MIFYSYNTVGQVSLNNAKRINDILYDVLDKNTGQLFSFTKVDKYLDGTKMDSSKCDNIIFIKTGPIVSPAPTPVPSSSPTANLPTYPFTYTVTASASSPSTFRWRTRRSFRPDLLW